MKTRSIPPGASPAPLCHDAGNRTRDCIAYARNVYLLKPAYPIHGQRPLREKHRPATRQTGVAAVEFSAVALIFFLLIFGIIELARAMYICNTLQEVTRRAAALAVNTDFSNGSSMQHVRELAIFRESPGGLVFASPVTDQHVKIDYLRIPAGSTVPVSMTGGLPASPQENRINCLKDANGANCIRLVRVRICLPGSDSETCNQVPYQTLVSLIPLSFSLPRATTIAKIETLGIPCGTP